MSLSGPPPLPHRPALLVGYGAFGLDLLRRLLTSAAPRGVLSWEEPRGGASPSDRHLQDLALLWVRDRFDPSETGGDAEDAREGSAIEMMRDLYRQIEQVGEASTPEDDLAAAFAAAAQELLSASGRAGRGALPLGLDVVVLARPTGPEVIGLLDRMLTHGMERLADNPNLERAVQGAAPLSFTAILDFENYWDKGDGARRVRRALLSSVEQWQTRRAAGRPGFGRVYLVDGRTDDGFRDAAHRMDEISLFLEFLLFEGQRSGELQRLYQSAGLHESPVATFGIRLLERSAGLLARLAAARFGIGWLDYLAGTRPFQPESQPGELRHRLAPFAPGALDTLVDGPALRAELDREVQALESEVLALSPDLPEWPRQVADRHAAFLARCEARLSRSARERLAEIGRERLSGLPEELRAGIDADLHHPRQPVPLGAVIAEVEARLAELERADEPPPAPPTPPTPPKTAAEAARAGLARLHDAYRRFTASRVSVPGLRSWWPLLALVLAAGLTPLATDLLADLPRPGPQAALWLTQASRLLRRLNRPFVLAPVLFFGAWALGGGPFQRRIAGRLDRVGRFYTDACRGRFVDHLRAGLAPGGALRAPADRLLAGLLRDLSLAVRSEIGRELGQVASRLRQRRSEMIWLREQLRAFLGLHGLAAEGPPDLEGLIRDSTGIRQAVERGRDFERMLESNPPTPERFLSLQAEAAPFAGWERRYSDAFLYSLAFIDDLSRIYKDPFLSELARPGTGPEQETRAREFLAFLASQGSFDLAFHFKAQEGLPPDRRYCLLPAAWRRLPGVLPALSDLRMGEEQVMDGADVARAYLLRLQLGVAPACLVEMPEGR